MKNLRPIGIPHSIILENLLPRTFDASKLDEDADRVRGAYRDRGYFKALTEEPQTHVRTTTGFNPFTNGFDGFLVGAFVFEDVGVTAYNGAAPLISNAGITAGFLSAAAGILAVEAYHAAYVRTALTGSAMIKGTTAYPFYGYANQVSALRGKLGGWNETPLTGANAAPSTIATVGTSSIVAADTTNAIAFHRTVDQVLHIVYGTFSPTAGATTPAAGVKSGGFFPNGLNGKIAVTNS